MRCEPEHGEYELDESYFEAKRGRRAAEKTPVFGLLKRSEKVFVTIVPNCTKETLMPIIKGLILEQLTIYTDSRKAYDGLVLNGYEHYRVFQSENEFARGKSHVNGIEKFNGCNSFSFALHLDKYEWRYNHRNDDLLVLIKSFYKKTYLQ